MSVPGPPSGAATERSGLALAVVLWLLVVVGGAASGLLALSRYEAESAFNARVALESHYGARAGIADAVSRLGAGGGLVRFDTLAEERRGERVPRPDPGIVLSFTDAVGAVAYEVEVLDANSRINVNRATESMLVALLRDAGVGREATPLAQKILDWIDEDALHRPQGAEADAYPADARRLPRNGPIRVVDELRWVLGMRPEILYGSRTSGLERDVDGIAQWLTTTGSGRINLNTAPREVLSALPGFTPAVVDVVLELRRERPITSLSQVSQHPALAGAIGLQRESIRLLRMVKTDGRLEHVRIRSAAFRREGPLATVLDVGVELGTTGIRVESWRERTTARESAPAEGQ